MFLVIVIVSMSRVRSVRKRVRNLHYGDDATGIIMTLFTDTFMCAGSVCISIMRYNYRSIINLFNFNIAVIKSAMVYIFDLRCILSRRIFLFTAVLV